MRIIWISLCLVMAFPAVAQRNLSIDSMIQLVEEGKVPDTAIAFLQYEIGYNLRRTNPVKAHMFVDRAIEKAIELNHHQLEHQAYRIKGVIYATERKYKECFDYLYLAINYGQKSNDYNLLAACYMSLGDVLLGSRSFVLAKKYVLLAYEYHKKANNHIQSGYTKRMLANVEYNQGHYKEALYYFEDALNTYLEMGMNEYIHGAYNDIGLCYKNMGMYEDALKNYDLSIEQAQQINPEFAALVNGNKGEVYLIQNEYHKAIEYLKKDLAFNRNNIFEINSTINTYTQIATAYSYLGNQQLALTYIDSAIHLIDGKSKFKNAYILQVYKFKAQVLMKMNKEHEANANLMKYIELTEEIQKQNDNVNALESQINMEISNQENQVSVLRTKLDSEQLMIRYIVIFATVLIVGLLLIFYLYRRSKHTLTELKKQYEVSEKQQSELDSKNKQIEVNNDNLQLVNEKLRELNEEKNEFLRLVAHDLKNPLSRVLGLTYLIEGEPENKVVDEKEKLDYIKQSVEEMNALIERFLDVNRIESGQQKVHMGPVNLVELVESECAGFAVQAKEKMIELRVHHELHEYLVQSDAQIIKLIFTNILSNAIKFSMFHQAVDITIKDHNGTVLICVKDNGPGLSANDRQQIFKKYTRLSARPTGNETSSGLGLYLVKKMSEKIGIKISYESEWGKGTEMIIAIPKQNSLGE